MNMNPSGQPRSMIYLTPSTPVYLLVTLDAVAGLRKSAYAIVHSCAANSVRVRLFDGSLHRIPRTTHKFFCPSLQRTIIRTQLPLNVAFAATTHRVQGETLRRLLLDLRRPVFAHGMLCVNVSRVRRREMIRCILHVTDFDDQHIRMINNVHQDLLCRE